MPKNIISPNAANLTQSKFKPKPCTRLRAKKVKIAKLTTKPMIIPIGLRLPPSIELDNIMGKIGNMQGETINANPSKKARTALINVVVSVASIHTL